MNRRLTLVTVVAVASTLVVGLLHTIQLHASASAESSVAGSAAAVADVGFTRFPVNQGEFTQASSTAVFQVKVENTGAALTDTYELNLDSSWPAELFGLDGQTPLSDTNGNGDVDTGVVLKGQSFTITAKITTPVNAKVGDANDAVLSLQSGISPTLAMTAMMQSAVPAPFAQSLYQQSDDGVSLIMSQPNGTWQTPTDEDQWQGGVYLAEMAVAETMSGYVYIWNDLRVTDGKFFNELDFILTDKPGQPVTEIAKLAEHSSATDETWDLEPAVDVTPNGNIGVAWARRITQDDGSELYNVYLSILDSSGQPVTDTINLTDNTAWRNSSKSNFDAPEFGAPRIAATKDNHFFVAWEQSVLTYTEQLSVTYVLDDIYYAILASDGVSVTDAINISNNVPGENTSSRYPAMAGVKYDRVFFTWAQRIPDNDDIQFTVIDTSNTIIREQEPIADDVQPSRPDEWYNSDVVELSNGQIIAAWLAFNCFGADDQSPRIRYTVFLPNNYNQGGQPVCLPRAVSAGGVDERVSLVADNQDRAIVTWTNDDESSRRQLFYALLKSNGQVITDPMIFFDSGLTGGLLGPGVRGYASASRIFLDAAIEIEPASEQGTSEDIIPFSITYRNYGAVTGTDVVITMSLAPSLSYHSGNAPVTPTIDGQNVIWVLPDALVPWAEESIDVQVSIKPGAALMHSYPLTATIGVGEQEASLENNSAQAAIVVKQPTFIPLLLRQD